MGDELIWPRRTKPKQRLRVVGRREAGEPAILPCHGRCSSKETTWTKHTCEKGSSYICSICSHRRHWGLQYWGGW